CAQRNDWHANRSTCVASAYRRWLGGRMVAFANKATTPGSRPRQNVSIHRLILRLIRTARLQLELWKLQAIALFGQIFLTSLFGWGAMMIGIVGVVFAYIFIFQLLSDVAHIPTVWVWGIFTGAHLLLAMTMLYLAARPWRKRAS